MIYSMTGFAVAEAKLPSGTFNLELRSVNHRYLEIQFRMADEFRALEPALRELISKHLSRGKVECRLSYTPIAEAGHTLQINDPLFEQLLAFNHEVQSRLPTSASLSVGEILRWPGIIGTQDSIETNLSSSGISLLQTALEDMSATRAREGEKLKAVLAERVAQMYVLIATVLPLLPKLMAGYQEKLASRLRDVLGSGDDDRVRQELALFAQKIDVDEELSRLQAHLSELSRILESGGAVGKRLDFLMQELNREANTLGSKSVATETSRISMELKVLIEQMREQIQNIE